MPNRLAQESSPYLLQHQDNPVDWFPWGSEALEKSRREDKPIFLSIGYSACHWCHVMEHESFEDAEIAEQLNAKFVPIKVDREERPDLDQIYMNAVQMLTGHGGWPMSVFLTPEAKPFYGGTYWPARSQRGMPGFDQILSALAEAWESRRPEALESAERITAELCRISALPMDAEDGAEPTLDRALITGAVTGLEGFFDRTHGGFGDAPKFPHPLALDLLLHVWQREPSTQVLEMIRTTLDKMSSGGIYDHLGGGFARYSVDARWLVPHFEKMLYDNALLAGVYASAFAATGEPQYATVTRQTLDYLGREMTDPGGGIYSTEDADSEGEEGRFYTWTPAEIEQLLGHDAAGRFCHVYDVSPDGNFEGRNILHRPRPLSQTAALIDYDEAALEAELATSRQTLFAARDARVRPGRDDKVLVAWNGLAIDALARAGVALHEPVYLDAARQAARFIAEQMRAADGQLLHVWRNGTARLEAYLDDYACLANGLISLHQATHEEAWLTWATELADTMLAHFADAEHGGFFFTADNHEALITRTKEFADASTPSGNGMAATALVRLAKQLDRADYRAAAEKTLQVAAPVMRRAPLAAGQLLLALHELLDG